MNIEKVSPNSLNEEQIDCNCANSECQVCGSVNVDQVANGCEIDGEWASLKFTCSLTPNSTILSYMGLDIISFVYF